MKRIILLLILLSACTSISYEEHTNAGSKYVLKNGMIILLKENPDTGIVAIDLMVKKSLAANGDKHGLGYFTNRMLMAGTPTRTKEQITKEIESAGGTIQARTYAEYSEIIITVPSDSVSVALKVLEDILLNSNFPPEEVEKERTLIISEIESKKDQPNVMAEEAFMRTMYEGHPYQHPIDGYVETVQAITRDDLIRHYKSWYVPNAIIVSIVGNIKEKPTISALQRIFGKLEQRALPNGEAPLLPQRLAAKSTEQNMALESFYIQHGYQLVPAVHPDFIKLRMANAILGSGSGSRLFYELRDKRALAYTVYSIAPSTRTTGFLKIAIISRPQVLNDSISGIIEQIEILKTEEVPEEELKLVKQKIRGFFLLDHQRTADQANYLGLYEMQGLGYHYDVEYPDRISAVTAPEVQYVATKYFNNPATAVVGPFEEVIK
ncbi:MAG: pitrilysin family protein [Candidatus Woesearchaeota archaeon]